VRKIYLILAASVLLSSSAAYGQYVAAIMACSRDVTKFCNGGKFEENRLAECSKAHFEEFGEPCKSALVKIASVSDACKADTQQQCSGTKLGAGRLLLCFKKHFSALSESCKDAIGHAATKRQ
jgi:hypothetical protein